MPGFKRTFSCYTPMVRLIGILVEARCGARRNGQIEMVKNVSLESKKDLSQVPATEGKVSEKRP
jgi:hypothetical protein